MSRKYRTVIPGECMHSPKWHLTALASAGAYVMVRFPYCTPHVVTIKYFDSLAKPAPKQYL